MVNHVTWTSSGLLGGVEWHLAGTGIPLVRYAGHSHKDYRKGRKKEEKFGWRSDKKNGAKAG